MTSVQQQTLDFIRDELARTGGIAPTLAEIGAHVGVATRSAVHRTVSQLVRQGLLVRDGSRERGLSLPGPVLAAATDAALLAECRRRGLIPGSAADA